MHVVNEKLVLLDYFIGNSRIGNINIIFSFDIQLLTRSIHYPLYDFTSFVAAQALDL